MAPIPAPAHHREQAAPKDMRLLVLGVGMLVLPPSCRAANLGAARVRFPLLLPVLVIGLLMTITLPAAAATPESTPLLRGCFHCCAAGAASGAFAAAIITGAAVGAT